MQQELFKKLTEEVRAKIVEAMQSAELKDFVEKTKAAEDTGAFEVVVSTDYQDRQGESIDQNGWDLAFFKSNPVVLWAHDYFSLPIGICDEITKEGNQLKAKGRFAPAEANPFAQQVRRLYDAGIIRATSVGFIAREMQGNVITKAELLEFSFVNVPANPYALSLRKAQELGLDMPMLATKGLNIEVKQEEEAKKLVDEHGKATPEPQKKDEKAVATAQFKEAIEILKQAIVAVEQTLKGSEAEETCDGGTPNQRSNNAGAESVIKEFDDFLATRQLLREISTQVDKALERVNEKIRAQRKSK